MTTPLKPMLAMPLAKGVVNDWTEWAIEEKFDGHRLVVYVFEGQLGADNTVTAWTRPRKHAGCDGKTMVVRELPPHLVREFASLPCGVYDGELLAGLGDGTSTDVTRLDTAATRHFVVFDILMLGGRNVTGLTYDKRRDILEGVFLVPGRRIQRCRTITLAASQPVTCEDDVTDYVSKVWNRKGEGAILKRRAATYQCGKRSTDFLKVKRLESAVLTVVGFERTKGTVMNRGVFAKVLLRDNDGNETSCKTRNDDELARFQAAWLKVVNAKQWGAQALTDLTLINTKHPSLGRQLRIDFPMRTRTGGYQGPVIWDRWENE